MKVLLALFVSLSGLLFASTAQAGNPVLTREIKPSEWIRADFPGSDCGRILKRHMKVARARFRGGNSSNIDDLIELAPDTDWEKAFLRRLVWRAASTETRHAFDGMIPRWESITGRIDSDNEAFYTRASLSVRLTELFNDRFTPIAKISISIRRPWQVIDRMPGNAGTPFVRALFPDGSVAGGAEEKRVGDDVILTLELNALPVNLRTVQLFKQLTERLGLLDQQPK